MPNVFGPVVFAKDLIPGNKYILAPFDTSVILLPSARNKTKKLIEHPHLLIHFVKFDTSVSVVFHLESDISDNDILLNSDWWPDKMNQKFIEITNQKTLKNVMNTKAKEYTIRKFYENTTGTSGQPGHGPVNTILKMAEIGRKYGGGRGKSKTRKSKNYRKRKHTRKA